MRIRCGTRWTQMPLTFCCGQKPEQKEASPAPLNKERIGTLAELLKEMATKTTDTQLWSWKLRVSRQINNLSSADKRGKVGGKGEFHFLGLGPMVPLAIG
jgi:hypothetical protein